MVYVFGSSSTMAQSYSVSLHMVACVPSNIRSLTMHSLLYCSTEYCFIATLKTNPKRKQNKTNPSVLLIQISCIVQCGTLQETSVLHQLKKQTREQRRRTGMEKTKRTNGPANKRTSER